MQQYGPYGKKYARKTRCKQQSVAVFRENPDFWEVQYPGSIVSTKAVHYCAEHAPILRNNFGWIEEA
jgi:hypothetical protein